MSAHFDLDGASWSALCHAPLAVWLAMSGLDPVVESVDREAAAFETALARARRRHPDDAMVQALCEAAVRPSQPQRRGAVLVDEAALLAELRAVRAALDAHCDPAQAARIAHLLHHFGYDVARAASESPLGGGNPVSQAEEHFLEQAGRALGLYA